MNLKAHLYARERANCPLDRVLLARAQRGVCMTQYKRPDALWWKETIREIEKEPRS